MKYNEAKEESKSFCNNFIFEEKQKDFVRITLSTIGCFLIRRFFYPSSYFKDPSFFKFDKCPENYEEYVKRKIKKMLLAQNEEEMKSTIEKVPDNEVHLNKIYEFEEKEFFLLRGLGGGDAKNFQLVFHIKSQHVFMKKTINSEHFKREIEFCEKFQHPSLMRCYGFIRSSKLNVNAIIYEFLSNGPLNSYIQKVDDMFSIISIYRIFEGIEYLQSNHLIHRDLKPQNVLLDHDFIPYISDLETIRSPDENQTVSTFDFGAELNSSPEQLKGQKVSYPTDIYSFGLLIYFIYEKENMIKSPEFFNDLLNGKEITQMKNGTVNMQNIYNSCVKINPNERITIDEIKGKLFKDFCSFSHLDKCFINQINLGHIEVIVEYFYEMIKIIKSLNDSVKFDELKEMINDHFILKLNFDQTENSSSSSFHNIGHLYENGKGFIQNYFMAKKYYELASQLENSESYLALGDLYYYGRGVNKDYHKAKEFYEKSAKYNNSYAFSYLGELYLEGFIGKRDYLKAKEYFELSAQLDNSDGIFNLGRLYADGLGVKTDYNKAKEYFEKSAEKDNPRAFLNLGDLYLNPNCSFYDHRKAIECYESSAQLDNSFAYVKLGDIYYHGYFVDKDIDIAKYYYEESSKLGNKIADIHLKNIEIEERYQGEKGKELFSLLAQCNSIIPQQQVSNSIENAIDSNESSDPFSKGFLYYEGIIVPKNYEKALFYFEIAAGKNHPEALLYLGNMYMNGYGVDINFIKAKEYYEQSAEQGNSSAIFQLGELHRIGGNGIEQDYLKAKEYYETAANMNNILAFLQLGILYYLGNGIKQDYNQAKKYFELSYKQNHPCGSYYLGLLYFKGQGVEKDYKIAKDLFEQSEKVGNIECLNYLGYIYYNGFGVEKDYSVAKQYFEKSKNSNGYYELGNMYCHGYGVKQDYKKAKEYFELAGKENDKALFNLGLLHFNGHGVEKDYQKARKYFELAGEKNNSNALYNLGCFYFYGDGVEKDIEKALKYYESSAKLNNTSALNNLGIIYLYNEYGHKDYEKALNCLNKSANLNDSQSIFNLGCIYLDGIGVPKDSLRAIWYFELSANFGYSNALVNLGCIHYNGLGVEVNYQKAKEYFEQSIKNPNSFGYLYLGLLYHYGEGVEQDYSKAKKYFELSSFLNNSYAILSLGFLYERGLGVEKDHLKAKEYFIMAAEKNNPHALYILGSFYLNGNIFKLDIDQAIKCFLKCSNIEYDKNTNKNGSSNLFKNQFNNHSENDLGFIYLSFFDDYDKANYHFKNAAFNEYPFAQNNFGLFNQFYINNIKFAQYMYERSSKHNFALAQYNLGYLCEIDNKPEQSIQHYINASNNQDAPLIFHNRVFSDSRLDISKMFIICFTNLKLVDFYLLKQDYEESRKYFIRSLAKLKIIDSNAPYKFHFLFDRNSPKESFSYLESFILNFPLFNLNKKDQVVNDKKQSDDSNNDDFKEGEKTEFQKKKDNLIIEKMKKNSDSDDFYYPNDFHSEINDEDLIFDDPDKLFDFFYPNNELRNIFHLEIQKIIRIMKEIIYTPPYAILLGRINIEKTEINVIDERVLINELFYEGFDHIELQYDHLSYNNNYNHK